MCFDRISPEMLHEFLRTKLLLTGIELKVFNQLSEPKSSEDVAQVLGTHPRNTGVFLDALTAINLIEKKGGLYRNLPMTQTFLVEGSPKYLGTGLQMMHSEYSLENLSKLVKEGPSPTPEAIFSEEMVAQAAAMYASSERAVDAHRRVGPPPEERREGLPVRSQSHSACRRRSVVTPTSLGSSCRAQVNNMPEAVGHRGTALLGKPCFRPREDGVLNFPT